MVKGTSDGFLPAVSKISPATSAILDPLPRISRGTYLANDHPAHIERKYTEKNFLTELLLTLGELELCAD